MHDIKIVTISGHYQSVEILAKHGALPAKNRHAFADAIYDPRIARINFIENGKGVVIDLSPPWAQKVHEEIWKRAARALIQYRRPGTVVDHVHLESTDMWPEEWDVVGFVTLSLVNDGEKFIKEKN